MKLLVVGCGSIGSRHAANAKTLGVSEVAVVDTDRDCMMRLASSVGARPFASVEAALDWHPHAAIVCTPPSSHIPVAIACASAGCDLLIEKPLAASDAGIDRLKAIVAARQLKVALAYQMRFHPALRRMRDLVSQGAIGRLMGIQAEYGQYLPSWRPMRDYRNTYTSRAELGGGILLDGSHEIDYVRWLAGEVAAVYARAQRLSDLEVDVEDTAALVLAFQSGAVGEVHLDFVQRGYSRRCVVIGTEGTVKWDVASGLQIVDSSGARTSEPIVPAPNDPYVEELRAFVAGDLAGFASLDDGARIVDIVAAARRSSAERREVAL